MDDNGKDDELDFLVRLKNFPINKRSAVNIKSKSEDGNDSI